MHLADTTVWMNCAMTVAVFDIGKVVENGKVIEPVHENTNGTIRFDMNDLFLLHSAC